MDKEEFKLIYDEFFDPIYKYTFLHVKNQEDSLDIVQEVFLKLYTSNKIFNEKEHTKAWLLRCAYNACIDHFRANKKYSKNVEIEKAEDLSQPFETDETLELILALPEKYKATIYLHYYEGYSTEEIAKLLKKPNATIRTHLKRGRELLKLDLV